MDSSRAKPDHLYRSGVGIMVINQNGEIFLGKRIDNKSNAWQMPQGGIDDGEIEDAAMVRELKEETGIDSQNIAIISRSKNYYYYDLPQNLRYKFWGGKYLGQKQRWYLVRFVGGDCDINIRHSPENCEFSEWRWAERGEMLRLIVPFKKKLYISVLNEFSQYFNGN